MRRRRAPLPVRRSRFRRARRPAAGDAATVEAVFTFGPSEVGEDVNELAARTALTGRLDRGPHGPDDIAYLLYTGGTTGVPKTAVLSNRAVVAHYYGTALGWDLPEQPRYLAVAPITHAAGMLITPTLLSGGTVILQRRFDPAAWLQGIGAERVILGLLVPTVIYTLLDHPQLESADLSSLQTVMYGASPSRRPGLLRRSSGSGPCSVSCTARRSQPARAPRSGRPSTTRPISAVSPPAAG